MLLEEELVFYVNCLNNMGQAKELLLAAKSTPHKAMIRDAIVGMAMIHYAKCFKPSYGVYRPRWTLDESHVPQHVRNIHKKVIAMRDQVLAHEDLKLTEPRLSLRSFRGGKCRTITSTYYSPILEAGGISGLLRLFEAAIPVLDDKAESIDASIRNRNSG